MMNKLMAKRLDKALTIVVIMLMLLGWLMNVAKMAQAFDTSTSEVIVRFIGVLWWPLGVIIGYF